jgi:hypothetical protein
MKFYINSNGIDRYKIYNERGVVVGESTSCYVDEVKHLLITNRTITKRDVIELFWK